MPSPGRIALFTALLLCFAASCRGEAADGNEACAGCHQKIYDSYAKTAMANASGPAIQGLIPGEFVHKNSGVIYRIYQQDGKAWLSYERVSDSAINGTRELLYYIGSNRTGRSYLFSTDGFLFESPVNWYAQKRLWDMAPAYQGTREIPLNLPATPDCLTCHSSGMKPPLAGTENRYMPPAITHFGITCERCHGDDVSHASHRGGSINPSSLSPERRDAICMQCHLEGTVAISRPGKHLYDFRPGDSLGDYMQYFVLKTQNASRNPALSQVEAIAQSVCKQKSGDRMSCMSCHDPHYSPPKKGRADYYRAKCLNCHGAAFAKRHHANLADCTPCHMPFTMGTAVAHTQATDHRILRRPAVASLLNDQADLSPELVPFPPKRNIDNERELALAWESLAERGVPGASTEAYRRLQSAITKNPADPALLSALGFIEQRRGKTEDAADQYRRALKSEPDRLDAAMNFGVIEAQSGELDDAIRLWQNAFQRAPWQSAIGLNLAFAYCGTGKIAQAREVISRILKFNPDDQRARKLLGNMNSDESQCAASQPKR